MGPCAAHEGIYPVHIKEVHVGNYGDVPVFVTPRDHNYEGRKR